MNAASPTDKAQIDYSTLPWSVICEAAADRAAKSFIVGAADLRSAMRAVIEAGLRAGHCAIINTTLPPPDLAREVAKALEGKGFCVMPVEPTEAIVSAGGATPQMQRINGAVALEGVRAGGKNLRDLGDTWDTSALAEAYRAQIAAGRICPEKPND